MPPFAAIWTLACKDLRLLGRDRAAVFFTAVFPVIFGVLFGLVFGQASGGSGMAEVPVVIVDQDDTPDSKRLARTIGAIEGVSLLGTADLVSATRTVRTGDAALAVIVPSGYADAIGRVIVGDPVKLGVIFDPSRGAQRMMLEGQLQGVVFQEMATVMGDPQRRAHTADLLQAQLAVGGDMPAMQRMLLGQGLAMLRTPLPASDPSTEASVSDNSNDTPSGLGIQMLALDSVSVADVPEDDADGVNDTEAADGPGLTNAFELTIPQGVAWGLMGCVLGFGLSLTQESQGGTLRRLLVSPCRPWHLLAGKGIACGLVAVVVQTMLYAVAVSFFGVRPESWPMLAVAVVVSAFAFAGLMLAFAGVSRTVGAAEGMGRAALLTLALLGGAGVPLFFMPGWMQSAASISPFKWLILAHEAALWRGTSGTLAMLPLSVLALIGVGGSVLGTVSFARWRHRAL